MNKIANKERSDGQFHRPKGELQAIVGFYLLRSPSITAKELAERAGISVASASAGLRKARLPLEFRGTRKMALWRQRTQEELTKDAVQLRDMHKRKQAMIELVGEKKANQLLKKQELETIAFLKKHTPITREYV